MHPNGRCNENLMSVKHKPSNAHRAHKLVFGLVIGDEPRRIDHLVIAMFFFLYIHFFTLFFLALISLPFHLKGVFIYLFLHTQFLLYIRLRKNG